MEIRETHKEDPATPQGVCPLITGVAASIASMEAASLSCTCTVPVVVRMRLKVWMVDPYRALNVARRHSPGGLFCEGMFVEIS